MRPFVALLRGINVGGNNILPMQKFRELLSELKCQNVATYIQSGNAVFSHTDGPDKLSAAIADAVEAGFGFRPAVMVLDADAFTSVVAANPCAGRIVDPKLLHVWFLKEEPTAASTESLSALQAETEQYWLSESAFYLHAPDGIGRSKLGAKVEKCLGVEATARNWRTVGKIEELLRTLG